MTILAVLGYLILFLLAWVAVYVLAFTASRAWHDGKVQAENQATKEIRRLFWDTSLNSIEILRVLSEHTDRNKRILKVTEKLLKVTIELNQEVGELLKVELKKLEEFEDEPPILPSLVS